MRTIRSSSLIGLVVVGVFWSVLFFEYALNDDWPFLNRAINGGSDQIKDELHGLGRFTLGWVTAMGFRLAGELTGLAYLRALAVFGLIVFGWVLRDLLVRYGMCVRSATTATLLAVTSPACAVYAAWATCFPYVWGAVLGVGALSFSYRAAQSWEARQWGVFGAWGVLALGFQVLAISTYQPLIALAFALPFMFPLVRPRCFIEQCRVPLLALVIAVAAGWIYKVSAPSVMEGMGLPAGQFEALGSMDSDLATFAGYFWREHIWVALGSWGILWGGEAGHYLVFGFTAIGVLGCLFGAAGRGRLLCLVCILAALAGSSVVNAMLGPPGAAARTALALYSVLGIVGVMGWWRLGSGCSSPFKKWALGLGGLMAGIQICAAGWFTYAGLIRPAATEISTLRSEIARYDAPKSSKILFQFPHQQPFGADFAYMRRSMLFREFGTYSSQFPWNTHHVLTLLLEERFGDIYDQTQGGFIGIDFPPHVFGIPYPYARDAFWDLSPKRLSGRPAPKAIDHPVFGQALVFEAGNLISKNYGSMDTTAYPWVYHSLWGWFEVRSEATVEALKIFTLREGRLATTPASFPEFTSEDGQRHLRFSALYLPQHRVETTPVVPAGMESTLP